VSTRGYVDLYTKFGERKTGSKTIQIRYPLVEANTSYNILLGRSSLNQLGAIVSSPHLAMKFPSPAGEVITVHVNQKTTRECYAASLRIEPTIQEQATEEPRAQHGKRCPRSEYLVAVTDLDPRLDDIRVEPSEEVCVIPLKDDEHSAKIGVSLTDEEKQKMTSLLQANTDMFAWTAADIPGVDPSIIVYKLSVYKEAKPVTQKKRKLGEEKRQAAKEEAEKLMKAGFIQEAHYTTWLANVVMVKKSNGKWRMCTDYTDLNRACPKDAYPLPNIDRLVDGASVNKLLSFSDAYFGYNQISMHPRDKLKTTFMTDSANYYYEVMPFGLKNAGATYQRLMDKVFKGLIGRNVEVYVDDVVVKSESREKHFEDLQEVFSALRIVGMRLNPEKCVFGVEGGKFLGFMLTHRGIEANPDKCQAIIKMQNPRTVKEVQRLIGRVTALSRFMPKMAERMKPIINLLKKTARFQWDDNYEDVFKELKNFLASPPVI